MFLRHEKLNFAFRNSKYIILFMPYKIKEYIADVRVDVHGKNLEQLFNDAFLGMMYIMKPVQKFTPEKIEREISLESIDTTTLLVDFLNEVFSMAIANKEFYTHAIFYKIQLTSLRVKLFGISAESFHKAIRTITYHEAEVRQIKDGTWETTLVFNR